MEIISKSYLSLSKIGSVAMAAALNSIPRTRRKTFNIILCPSHVAKKWVREIAETLPNTFGMVVRGITEFDKLYELYE